MLKEIKNELIDSSPVFKHDDFKRNTIEKMKQFERQLIKAMRYFKKKSKIHLYIKLYLLNNSRFDGWNGSESEDESNIQWTFTNSFFYAIGR